MTKLESLKWTPRWVSHVGCLKGCLDYLGVEVTDAWLYGACGHAFVLNIAEGVCPSGPTAWNNEMLYELVRNVGVVVERVCGSRYQGDLGELQKRAREHATRALDAGLPCYGWELDVPEYYVVFGYDDVGYHYSGCRHDGGTGPKPWNELGNTGIGWVEMDSVTACAPAPPDETVVKALSFALEFSEGPDKWTFGDSSGGLDGYRSWIGYLESGRASAFGMGYNAAVWAECRRFAAAFLREAEERLDSAVSSELAQSAGHYDRVHEFLTKVSEAYPFSAEHGDHDTLPVDATSARAVEYLGEALTAEEEGLGILRGVAAAMAA